MDGSEMTEEVGPGVDRSNGEASHHGGGHSRRCVRIRSGVATVC